MTGAKIENLQDLLEAHKDKRAVICPKSRPFSKPHPAAFMIHQSGYILYHLFKPGMFIYEKEK